MTVNPTFPVSQEMFRDIVRLHVYGRTNEAIAKELGLELRVILELRRDFAEGRRPSANACGRRPSLC